MLVATPKIFQNQFSFNLGLLISLYIHVIIILNLTVTVDGKVLDSRNIYNTRLFVTKTAVGSSLSFISSLLKSQWLISSKSKHEKRADSTKTVKIIKDKFRQLERFCGDDLKNFNEQLEITNRKFAIYTFNSSKSILNAGKDVDILIKMIENLKSKKVL